MNAKSPCLSLTLLGLALVVGCAKTSSAIDSTGKGDSRRTAQDAGDDTLRTVDDARRDDGGSRGAGGDAIDGPDDGSSSDDDSEPAPEGAGTVVAPSAPTLGPPPLRDPDAVREATWDSEQCHVPTIEAPSDASGEMSWTLAQEYCETIEAHGCLEDVTEGWHTLDNCSDEERIGSCLHLVLEIHNASVLPECEGVWRTAISCATQSFGEGCVYSGDFPYGGQGVCPDENEALIACVTEHSTWHDVDGSYASCSYGPGVTSACEVACRLGENYAALECGGPDGVPMRCSCSLNGIPLNAIPVGAPDPMWVDDCEDAARQAADGMCTSRLDCCFAYFDGENDKCLCGAIPERAGYDSCEALADSVAGHTVDICPQYEHPPSSCWPPPCE